MMCCMFMCCQSVSEHLRGTSADSLQDRLSAKSRFDLHKLPTRTPDISFNSQESVSKTHESKQSGSGCNTESFPAECRQYASYRGDYSTHVDVLCFTADTNLEAAASALCMETIPSASKEQDSIKASAPMAATVSISLLA